MKKEMQTLLIRIGVDILGLAADVLVGVRLEALSLAAPPGEFSGNSSVFSPLI